MQGSNSFICLNDSLVQVFECTLYFNRTNEGENFLRRVWHLQAISQVPTLSVLLLSIVHQHLLSMSFFALRSFFLPVSLFYFFIFGRQLRCINEAKPFWKKKVGGGLFGKVAHQLIYFYYHFKIPSTNVRSLKVHRKIEIQLRKDFFNKKVIKDCRVRFSQDSLLLKILIFLLV